MKKSPNEKSPNRMRDASEAVKELFVLMARI